MAFFKKSLVVSVLALYFSTLSVYAQEPNFSMYQYTPFFTNPGSIGTVQDVRAMLNYRNQTIDVGENFVTSSFSGYYPIYLGNHRLVVAGNLLNDQVSNFVKTNGGLLGVAYSIKLTASSELSFGLQGGFFQRKTASSYTTDDQFVDGVFDPNAVSGDALMNQSKNYPTLSTGLYYLSKDDQGRDRAFLGGSMFNATEPNISFLDAEGDNLPLSMKATAGYRVYQGFKLSVMPTARWVNQASNNFFNIGSRLGYELTNSEKQNKKIELGLWYNTNGLGVFSIAYEQSDLTIGASYDLPVGSDLGANQNGIFELAVSLRLKKKSKPQVSQPAAMVPVEPMPEESSMVQVASAAEVEETEPVREKEEILVTETTIKEDKLFEEKLNRQFSYRDYLIRFEHASGSNVISGNQQKVINEVIKVLQENPDLAVLIVGHASSVGGADANQKISEKRAEKIAGLLIEKGVATSRISTEGRGESEPIDDNSTDQGALENRRVQVIFRTGDL